MNGGVGGGVCRTVRDRIMALFGALVRWQGSPGKDVPLLPLALPFTFPVLEPVVEGRSGWNDKGLPGEGGRGGGDVSNALQRVLFHHTLCQHAIPIIGTY